MKTKAILVIMFVVAGFVVPGWAEFRTVGVYGPADTPFFNDADQSGTYNRSTGIAGPNNVLVLADIQGAVILAAFNADMGGVIDGEGGGDAMENGPSWQEDKIYAKYGTGGAKTLTITNQSGNLSLTTKDGGATQKRQPISGIHNWNKSNGSGFSLAIEKRIDGGDEGERVIMFGGTMLDRADRPMYLETIAYFSGGSYVVASASTNGGWDGENAIPDTDTFFGFIAPYGEYITNVTFNNNWTHLDDIFFITSTNFAPEIDSGPDQTVQVYDADIATGPRVLMDARITNSIAEGYTYAWTSVPAAGVAFSNAAVEDPNVSITAPGEYVLTLNVTGTTSGVLDADSVTITVVVPTANAGDDETVQKYDAINTGVTMDGSVDDPYTTTAEVYTYTWSSLPVWTGIDENGTTGADDAKVNYTATGEYELTLNITGTVNGALASDTVIITVVEPVLDAGDDVQVGKTDASERGIKLNSTLYDPITTGGGESYTYAWSSLPTDPVFTVDTDEDPFVTFPSAVREYTLTLTVTGEAPWNTVLVDTVTVNVTEDHIMLARFALDPGENAAGEYLDSSNEGEPNNHTFITDTIGSSTEHDGVMDCSDGDAIENNDNDPLEVHLDHDADGLDESAPHLDNVNAAITVALWIRNDYGQKVWAIEKVGTFAFGIDDNGDLRTKLWFEGAGEPNSLTKSRQGSGLGNDLENDNLKINADDDSGGHEHVWHHIAFTYDSFTGYVEQFLDGALIREEDVGSGKLLNNGPNTLAIGKNLTDFGQGVKGLRGSMDDIRIYNYALDYPELAGLAAMAEVATLVAAGSDVTVDPNSLPYQLQGRFIRLGQGVGGFHIDDFKGISPGNDDNEFYVVWEQRSAPDPNFPAKFTDPGDPETNVTFTKPGTYVLRLVSFERLCDSDNEIRTEMEITVSAPSDCAGVIALSSVNIADIVGLDCVVDMKDLAALAEKWGSPAFP